MSFHIVVRHRFPGSIAQREYVSLIDAELRRVGFAPDTTLVAVGRCRDELTSSLPAAIEARWGPVFDLAGLAGLLSAGLTGVEAALGHAPIVDGRARLVVVAMSHVGIADDGTVGALRRPGLDHPVAACGSLRRLLDGSGRQRRRVVDPALDLEQSHVEAALGPLPPGTGADLADLARLALARIEADAAAILDRLAVRSSTPLDHGLLTGVQIHGPLDRNLVWPSLATVEVGGEAIDILPDNLRALTSEATGGTAGPPGPAHHQHPHRDHGRYQPSHHDGGHHEHQHHEHQHHEHQHHELGRHQHEHHDLGRYTPQHRDLGRYEPHHDDRRTGGRDPEAGAAATDPRAERRRRWRALGRRVSGRDRDDRR